MKKALSVSLLILLCLNSFSQRKLRIIHNDSIQYECLVDYIDSIVFVNTNNNPQTTSDTTVINLFNNVVFYDGYQVKNNPDSLIDDGVLRLTTYQYAVKLTDEQLSQIGTTLSADVKLKAICDNYDRIGSINLAIVPKGQTKYDPDSVSRIELGRFITPFMNKNKQPDTVPYAFWLDYVSYILRDANLRADYDLWMELEVFGVPYAAQQQIIGCTDRTDVYAGTFNILTDSNPAPLITNEVLVPITIRQPDWRAGDLCNYKEGACDTLGKTEKTYYFDVPKDVEDGQLVIVTSNHGAGTNGEEYNRRWHYIYVDDSLSLVYKPGRTSCEPFRKYNTQKNGIYNGAFGVTTKMSDAKWQSFSNWCPGDVIDNRIINLGAYKAGRHKVKISVPDAVFYGSDGKIPVSIFFQGLTDEKLVVNGIEDLTSDGQIEPYTLNISIDSGKLQVEGSEGIMSIEVRDLQGKLVSQSEVSRDVNISNIPSGIYLVSVEMMNGIIETRKMQISNNTYAYFK